MQKIFSAVIYEKNYCSMQIFGTIFAQRDDFERDIDVGLMAEQRQQRLMILIRPDVQDIDITQLTRLTKPQIHLR